MIKNFRLGTILTSTTGINFTNTFDELYALNIFVFNEKCVSSTNFLFLKSKLKEHILSLYPELENVHLDKNIVNVNSWLRIQEQIYGKKLAICEYGEKFPERIKK